ncbi:MAG: hypothetical protein JXA71_02955 [Chitinispirillaceae bacterium]|nr:hypothetical protein [Chitinispirillaceae bacterium]
MNKLKNILLISLCSLMLSGGLFCDTIDTIKDYFTKEPEVDAVAEVLRIALPIGYAARTAMAAVNGETVDDGIVIVSGIKDSTGPALITIPVSSTHPLPIGSNTGTLVVSGYWSSMNEAVMAMVLNGLDIPTATATFDNIQAFPVLRDSTGIQALYARQWVNVGKSSLDTSSVSASEAEEKIAWGKNVPTIDSSASVDQDVWIIRVKHKGTPGDPLDDEYGLMGVGQYAGKKKNEAYLVQLIMLGACMKASCRKNPVVDNIFSGGALLNTFEAKIGADPSTFPKIGRALFTYHDACDGRIDLKIATGCYIGRIGQGFALDLD